MYWIIFFIISASVLVCSVAAAIVYGKKRYKSGRILDPLKLLFAGVIVSSVLLFIPIYWGTFKSSDCGIIETLLISFHNMIRLFMVDGEFEFITDNLSGTTGWTTKAYTVLFAILFASAPVLTFVFVLSFFKNLSAYKRYFFHLKPQVFIFSELNEKSLALAQSLYGGNPKKRLFVFTNISEKSEDQIYELIEKAKELGAILFKKDIISVNFLFCIKRSQLNFFTIRENYSENITQSLKIIGNGKYGENSNLYVFSTQIESEILLDNAFDEGASSRIKVRRVNETQSLINRTLYDTGFEKIFEKAVDSGDSVKKINAVVIGLGQHGTEMTKALSWFCQMDGYEVTINSFDIDEMAEDRFRSLCPELMDDEHNRNDVDGEAAYKIKIHSGIDVDTKKFDDTVMQLPTPTYVFVALGNDEKNISCAIKLRTVFERAGYAPAIQAVVYDSDKKEALADIKNFKKQEYLIDFIGDLKSSYSEEVILSQEVEEKALARHKKYGDEQSFWQYDYNYKSSVASAIHYKMKCNCKIAGITKETKDRTEEELWAIRKLEHRRWNAYMRSQGYVFGEARYDLAKQHHCLVPFDKLPLEEQIKDDD